MFMSFTDFFQNLIIIYNKTKENIFLAFHHI